MIVTRTPLRISFLGGGTDYPDFFQHHGGQTIGASIDKYSYVAVHPRAGKNVRATYTVIEDCLHHHLQHPSIRESLRFFGETAGIEVNYMGDLPRFSGLGSSSSFTVGLLHALHQYTKDPVGQLALAREAVEIEQKWIGERVGVQDQYTCALGGILHLQIDRDGTITPTTIPLDPAYLADIHRHLLLFDTGIRRKADTVLQEQMERVQSRELDADLCKLGGLVEQGLDVLHAHKAPEYLGELLHAHWVVKRNLASIVTTDSIDAAYARARAAGAVGGKILGAGGGGMLLVLAPPKKHASVQKAVGLPLVPFAFEDSGSQVLFS